MSADEWMGWVWADKRKVGCGAEFNKRNKSGGERVGGVVYAGSTIMGEKTWVGFPSVRTL